MVGGSYLANFKAIVTVSVQDKVSHHAEHAMGSKVVNPGCYGIVWGGLADKEITQQSSDNWKARPFLKPWGVKLAVSMDSIKMRCFYPSSYEHRSSYFPLIFHLRENQECMYSNQGLRNLKEGLISEWRQHQGQSIYQGPTLKGLRGDWDLEEGWSIWKQTSYMKVFSGYYLFWELFIGEF
jgi:hypothetical protein